jgi:lysophospholipase L1-like esterase
MITPRVSRLFAFAASRKSLELRGVRALRPLLCSSSIDLSHTIGVMLFRSLFLVACFTVRIVAGAQEIQVVNAGIPGENSAEVKARFHNALKASHPSFVIICVGMNDAVNDRKFLPIAASIRNIDWMRNNARVAGAVPVLVTVHHVDASRVLLRHDPKVYGAVGPNERIDELDAALERLATTHRIRLVDLRAVFDHAGGATPALSPDGVHFNEAGYRLLADAVRAALPSHFSAATTVLCIGDSLTFGIGVRPVGASERRTENYLYPTYPAQLAEGISGAALK